MIAELQRGYRLNDRVLRHALVKVSMGPGPAAAAGAGGRGRGAGRLMADYYDLLGVSRDADADTLKRAYRRLARQYHPDINKDPGAEDRFKEIGRAYEVLSDPQTRARYDQFGEARPVSGAAVACRTCPTWAGSPTCSRPSSAASAAPRGGGGTRRRGPPGR